MPLAKTTLVLITRQNMRSRVLNDYTFIVRLVQGCSAEYSYFGVFYHSACQNAHAIQQAFFNADMSTHRYPTIMEALEAFIDTSEHTDRATDSWRPKPRHRLSVYDGCDSDGNDPQGGARAKTTAQNCAHWDQNNTSDTKPDQRTRSLAQMQREIIEILQLFQKGGKKGKLKTKEFWRIMSQHEAGRLEVGIHGREFDAIFLDALEYLQKGTRGEISMDEFLQILDKHMSKRRVEEVGELALFLCML